MDKNSGLSPEVVQVLNEPEMAKEVMGRVSGSVKLLLDPVLYAQGAIKCIEEQLLGVKGAKRKIKLESKLQHWKKVLEVLTEEEPNEPNEQKTAEEPGS